MDPFLVCDQLINYVKESGLNFCLYESPFGVTLNVKKSFIKGKDGNVVIPKHSFFHYDSRTEKKTYVKEIEALNCTIADLEANQGTLNNTIENLDKKLQESKGEIVDLLFEKNEAVKAKVEAEKKFSVEISETEKLKTTAKILKEEKDVLLKDKKTLTNSIKARDKEVHNLNVKNENLTFNLSNIKAEKYDIMNEKNKAAKELLNLKKKGVRIYSTSSKSTITPTILMSDIGSNTSISSKNMSTNTINLSPSLSRLNQELDTNQNPTKSSTSLRSTTPATSACSPGPPAEETKKEELEKKIEALKADNAKLLEGVSAEELIFTVEEITALGLDWKIHEEIADCLKKNF